MIFPVTFMESLLTEALGTYGFSLAPYVPEKTVNDEPNLVILSWSLLSFDVSGLLDLPLL